uniref:Uncharacterized protein n=1 Tax=Plectus sambesii TaxID=2011161 RepID=A0A914XKQ0_9BILA
MPGGEDADDVIVLDSSSNDDDCVAIDGKCEQVLFKKTFGIEGKKKARHKRFASSESSDGNEERHSRPDSSAAANFEVDDDADFVIDTETAAPKFSEDDDVVLDTNSTKRRDEEWP